MLVDVSIDDTSRVKVLAVTSGVSANIISATPSKSASCDAAGNTAWPVPSGFSEYKNHGHQTGLDLFSWGGNTVMVRLAFAAIAASSDHASIGRPPILCSGFVSLDFRRVPFPQRETATTFYFLYTHFH